MDYDALCRSPLRCWGHDDCREHPELGVLCGERPLEFHPGYGRDEERFVSPDVLGALNRVFGAVNRSGFPRGDGDPHYAAGAYDYPVLHDGERAAHWMTWVGESYVDGDGEHPTMCLLREGGGDRFWDNLLDEQANPLSGRELTEARELEGRTP